MRVETVPNWQDVVLVGSCHPEPIRRHAPQGKLREGSASRRMTGFHTLDMESKMNHRMFALLLLAAPLMTGCGYNRIQSLTQEVDAAQGNIQTQLQRRADLIPNLVNTVKGYAQHEDAVFTQVTQARAGLVN